MWQWVKQHFLILLIGHKAGSFITIVSSSAKCFQTREIMDNIYWLSKMVTYTGTSLVIQWLRLPVQGAQWEPKSPHAGAAWSPVAYTKIDLDLI